MRENILPTLLFYLKKVVSAETPLKERTLGELKGLIRKIPRLGEEAERF